MGCPTHLSTRSSDADRCCQQWARDRTQGSGPLPIEICVKKQARDTAYLYNLMDRGTLEPGKKADLNGATLGLSAPLFEKILEPRRVSPLMRCC